MSHEIHVIHEIASIQVTKHQTHYRRERTKFVKHILCNCDNVCAISFVRLQCANVSHYGYLGNSEPSDSSTQNPSAGHFPGNQCWKSLWTMSVQAIGDVSAAIVVRFDAWCMCRYLFFSRLKIDQRGFYVRIFRVFHVRGKPFQRNICSTMWNGIKVFPHSSFAA